MATLLKTNIPELTGVALEPVGFAYGGPLNRAALAGEVDVLLTADQPAMVLLDRSKSFKIVARMMYNRVCLYVPWHSQYRDVSELRGKSIAGPVGAAAERFALAELRGIGANMKDLRNSSLDMSQQNALLSASKGKVISGVDALYGFDPLPAVFEVRKIGRMLKCGKVVSVVVASTDMIENRPDELKAFLKAFALSWAYFAQNPEQSNEWFRQVSRQDFSDDVLELAASVEPNRNAKGLSGLSLWFRDDDYGAFDSAISFLLDRGVLGKPFDYKAGFYQDAQRAALKETDLEALFSRIRERK